MSRRIGNAEVTTRTGQWTQEEWKAIEQNLDAQSLMQVKDLLCTLWKQSRITLETRAAGENALSAALGAITSPHLRNITLEEGERLSMEQWQSVQGEASNEF